MTPLARSLLAAAALAAFAAPAPANALTLEEVNSAKWGGDKKAVLIKLQVLLDRENYSPGVVDGLLGENVKKAIRVYEEQHDLEVDGEPDKELWQSMGADGATVLKEYEITEEDVAGPFDEELPEDYSELAELDRMPYRTPMELLAEKFHMDQELLEELNPDADFSKAGTQIIVAQPGEPLSGPTVEKIEVLKGIGQIKAYDRDEKLVVAYPATIGSRDLPSPSGTHEVKAVALMPAYYYQPDKNFQQGDNDEPLKLPPGPNNPVGTVWIDLSEPTYGIHGSPEPAKIDKTFSHGCVRLTNWDAEELAEMVPQGTKVEFVD